MKIYIVVEPWDETNGYQIKGIYNNPKDAADESGKEPFFERWVQVWVNEDGKWREE